jgi:urease accessory protein
MPPEIINTDMMVVKAHAFMSKARPLVRVPPRKRGHRLDSNGRGNGRKEVHDIESAALYRLMIWLSPAYPIGAFSYSSGIEWAVEAGDITSAETLRQWLEVMLTAGAGINDAIFCAQTHHAVMQDDDAALVQIAELAAAFVPSRERLLETTSLGRSFMEVTQAAWPCPALAKLQRLWNGPIAYPVAAGAACAGHAIPVATVLQAFLTAVVSSWISAGVRLIPLGHTDSQRLLQALEPVIAATSQRALAATLDALGSASFRADLAGIRHETQYTRLFRS